MIKLIDLKYNLSDLEPVIDEDTVNIHHNRHHKAYVDNLNKFLEDANMSDLSLEEVLKKVPSLDEKIKKGINNNAGGVYLHNIYFEQFSKQPKEISGELKDKVEDKYETFENMINILKNKALTQFGSGWSALVIDKKTGELDIVQIANQDVAVLISQDIKPLVVLDVWEHAYYLKYQNKRAEYLEEVVKIIDWDNITLN